MHLFFERFARAQKFCFPNKRAAKQNIAPELIVREIKKPVLGGVLKWQNQMSVSVKSRI